MSQATENAKSTASSTASGSYEFSEVNASKKVYPLGEILATPNLRIFTYSELKAATRNFEIDTLLGEGAYGRVYKGSLHEKSMSESGSEALIAVKEVYSWCIPAFRNRWQVIPTKHVTSRFVIVLNWFLTSCSSQLRLPSPYP